MSQNNQFSGDPTEYNHLLDSNVDDRIRSARIVLSILTDVLSPQSVLDVGCGHGAWLLAAREMGIDTVRGVDGPWIDTKSLHIPEMFFCHHKLDRPLDLQQRFDLVLNIEVAEHLSETAADTLIESLVRHGDTILFSAAIPFQGSKSHVNEQWQTYWAQKFLERGYIPIDLIRPQTWGNEDVLWWLRQNCILYVNRSSRDKWDVVSEYIVEEIDTLSVVHPALYLRWVSMAGKLSQDLPLGDV